VQVLDATDQFPIKLGCLLLIQSRISDDKVEQLAAVSVLHNHKELLLCLDNLSQYIQKPFYTASKGLCLFYLPHKAE